jgi:hypothetical protein
VIAQGISTRDWSVTTGSSSVQLQLDAQPGFLLDALSRSGSVTVEGGAVKGSTAPHAVHGTVNNGGSTVRISTGSGSIRVQLRGS